MLFDRSRTDVQFLGNFPIAAPLHQKLQDLCITSRNLDFIEIHHDVPSVRYYHKQVFRQSFALAYACGKTNVYLALGFFRLFPPRPVRAIPGSQF